jgi:hypothetical protein
MVFPLPLLKPDNDPGAEAVQLNVVLATLDVKAIFVDWPEQMLCEPGVAVATGAGFINTL